MKLSPLTIFIIGISVVIAVLGVSLSIYMPNIEEAKYQNELANQLITEANKQSAANKKVEQAVEDVNKMGADWQRIVAVKTPPASLPEGINLAVNRWQLTNDSVQFRNSMQRALNRQLKRGGVTVVSAPLIPAPPTSATQIVEYYNYPAIKFPVLVFDLGTITVRGSLSQIMEHVRAWKNMPNYLAVADGLQITGTTPTMTGTYNLSVVAYIRGDKIAPPVPEGTGGGAPAGGGGPANGGNLGGMKAAAK